MTDLKIQPRQVASKISMIRLILVLVYLGLGLGFHLHWERELAVCRQARLARGEYVEPDAFGPPLDLLFDLIFWPVYASANIHHDGTPFATPCTKK